MSNQQFPIGNSQKSIVEPAAPTSPVPAAWQPYAVSRKPEAMPVDRLKARARLVRDRENCSSY